jgi:glycosyltransferase involved in cell wall biosynthesis
MKVSIITPTTESRAWFLTRCKQIVSQQDYPDLEHIIVHGAHSIGAKLNEGIDRATGDIIVRFDDDDLYADDYITRAVSFLTGKPGCNLTGLSKFYLYNPYTGGMWWYDYKGSMPYVAGSGMTFYKSVWQDNKFPDKSIGEDAEFNMKIRGVYPHGYDGMVAIIHGANTDSHSNLHTFQKVVPPVSNELIDKYYK